MSAGYENNKTDVVSVPLHWSS